MAALPVSRLSWRTVSSDRVLFRGDVDPVAVGKENLVFAPITKMTLAVRSWTPCTLKVGLQGKASQTFQEVYGLHIQYLGSTKTPRGAFICLVSPSWNPQNKECNIRFTAAT